MRWIWLCWCCLTAAAEPVRLLLPFCHPPGFWGSVLGAFQFFPLAVSIGLWPLAWWSRDSLVYAYSYYVNAVFLSAWALQSFVSEPVPNPQCYGPTAYVLVALTDSSATGFVSTTASGLPSLDAALMGALTAYVLGYYALWHRRVDPYVGVTLLVASVIVPLSLVLCSVATVAQVVVGLTLGSLPAVPWLLFLRTVLWEDVLRPGRNDWLIRAAFGSRHDLFLAGTSSAKPRVPVPQAVRRKQAFI